MIMTSEKFSLVPSTTSVKWCIFGTLANSPKTVILLQVNSRCASSWAANATYSCPLSANYRATSCLAISTATGVEKGFNFTDISDTADCRPCPIVGKAILYQFINPVRWSILVPGRSAWSNPESASVASLARIHSPTLSSCPFLHPGCRPGNIHRLDQGSLDISQCGNKSLLDKNSSSC